MMPGQRYSLETSTAPERSQWGTRQAAPLASLGYCGFVVILLLLSNTADSHAQTVRISLEPVSTGLNLPLYLAHAHDGTNRRFIVEQPGIISVIQPGSSARSTFLDIRS